MQKRFRFILLLHGLLLILGVERVYCYNQVSPFDTIEYALREGDTRILVSHLNLFVDITIDGKTQTCSKMQAELLLDRFFRQHPASSFSFVHTGHSKKGTEYAVGHYTSYSADYSVFIKTRVIKTRSLVYMISFVKG